MIRTIIRFIISALVLLFVSFILPGFSIAGFTGALLAAVIIAGLGWISESLLGENVSPKSRGTIGFLSSAVVIYLSQFILPNQISVSIIGALLASLVIGFVDAVIPTELR